MLRVLHTCHRSSQRCLVPGLLLAAACSSAPDPSMVARVGDWTLDVERLADLLVLAQPLPLDSVTVGAVVDQWIGMAALAQRAADGTDLTGEDARDASLWLERREAFLTAERHARAGAQAKVSIDRARAEFEADSLLLLAHVLRRAGAFTSPAERDLQRTAARAVLDGLLAGGTWADAVRQSEDEETRGSSGLLGLVRADALPSSLRPAASRLLPGQVSAVVESQQGFHILHRPRFEEVPDLYARLLSEHLAAEADARATMVLRDSLGVTVSGEAVATVRALAAADLRTDGDAPLAMWTGGSLRPDTAARYVAALPHDARGRLAVAPDDAVRSFVEQLALREARLAMARQRGVQPDPGVLDGLADMHRRDVEAWTAALSEGAAPLSRAALARHMERLVSRQAEQQPLPPLFRQWLLRPLNLERSRAAETAAIVRARRLLDAARRGGG